MLFIDRTWSNSHAIYQATDTRDIRLSISQWYTGYKAISHWYKGYMAIYQPLIHRIYGYLSSHCYTEYKAIYQPLIHGIYGYLSVTDTRDIRLSISHWYTGNKAIYQATTGIYGYLSATDTQDIWLYSKPLIHEIYSYLSATDTWDIWLSISHWYTV